MDFYQFLKTQGYKVTSVEVVPNDWSPRQFHRVSFADGSSLIGLEYANERNYPGHGYDLTVQATHYLYDKGVPVPKILASDDEHGFLLVEDFGAETIHDNDVAYMQAVDVLSRMARIPIQEGELPNYRDSYIYKALRFATEYWFQRPDLTADWFRLWDKLFDTQSDWPFVLSHMDCHAGNVLLRPNGQIGFIDHQAAMIAPLGYDFVNLIEDARGDLPLPLKRDAFQRYVNSLDKKYHYKLDDYIAILTTQFHMRVLSQIDRMAQDLGRMDMQQYRPQLLQRIQKGLDHPALSGVKSFLKSNDISV